MFFDDSCIQGARKIQNMLVDSWSTESGAPYYEVVIMHELLS